MRNTIVSFNFDLIAPKLAIMDVKVFSDMRCEYLSISCLLRYNHLLLPQSKEYLYIVATPISDSYIVPPWHGMALSIFVDGTSIKLTTICANKLYYDDYN